MDIGNQIAKNNGKLFETSFFADFKYWVREYDPKTQKSEIRKLPSDWEYYDYSNKGNYISLYNKDIRFEKRYGDSKVAGSKISPINPTDLIIRKEFRGEGRYNAAPRIFYLDIETRVGTKVQGFPKPDAALEPISLIQFLDSKTDIIHIIGDKDFYYKEYYLSLPDHKGKEVRYWKCATETEMLETFFKFLHTLKPLLIYAWNGEGFDFPYLYNRCQRLAIDVNKFSPFYKEFSKENVSLREDTFENKYFAKLEAPGIFYIDLLKLYRKFVLAPRPSYSLMNIAIIELKAKKIEHTEFKTFDDFYLGNYRMPSNPTDEQKETLCYKMSLVNEPYEEIQKAGHGQFVYYGVIDTVLPKDIDEKCGLTKLLINIGEKMSSQLKDVLGTTKPWGNSIRNRLYDLNIVINPKDIQVDLEKQIEGGFVRDPVTKRQKFVLSADVNSMYPILAIAGSNMSPETFKFWYQVPEDLSNFVREELHIGTPDEQNENNMHRLINNPEKLFKLKSMLKKYNLSMAPNGVFFDRSINGLIPQLVNEIYIGRKIAKKAMLRAEQAKVLTENKIKELNKIKDI